MCVDPIILSTTIISGICLIVSVVFYNLRRSRCTKLECGCINCSRQLMNTEEMNNDKLEIAHI